MKIVYIEKTTLIDYPGKVAATVFTHGCNFRCPFCHNPELVVEKMRGEYLISEEEVLAFMKKRQGLLDALVVTGGEPLLHNDIDEFLTKVKELGFLVKVDTNGSLPSRIEDLQKKGLVDYWAMDVKNSKERYLETIGLGKVGEDGAGEFLSKVEESIKLIKVGEENYEFRTTVVPGLHDIDSMKGIGELVRGSRRFYIQNFRAGKTIDKDYEDKGMFSEDELDEFKEVMLKYVKKVEVRE